MKKPHQHPSDPRESFCSLFQWGEDAPLPNATASFLGLTSVNYTPENLCRAAMEGATLGLRYGLEVLMAQGIEPTEIRLVGGGAKSRLWATDGIRDI